MAYKFDAKLEDILKIVYSEKKRVNDQKNSLYRSLKRLDELKAISSAPVSSTAELLGEKDGESSGRRAVIASISRLENEYIKVNQYIDFTKGTLAEIYNVGAQLMFLVKINRNEELKPDEKAIYLPVGIRDCNEILRYITVWDINGYVILDKDKVDRTVLDKFEDLDKGLTGDVLHEMNYKTYVSNLIGEYKNKLKEADEIKSKTLQEHDDLIHLSILYANKKLKFHYNIPYDQHDGTRDPIGCKNSKESQLLYSNAINALFVDYEAAHNKKQRKNEGRDLGR